MKSASKQQLLAENERLKYLLEEANDTLDAIRSGQIDALVVSGESGHSLFTLKTADHAYRVFIEQMAEGAVTLNSTGLIIYSNTQFASMVKLPLSSVLGSNFSQFVTNEQKEAFESFFQRGWQDNIKGELSIIGDDKPLPVLLSLKKLQLQDEVSLSLIVTDLTDQKRNEQELREKNEQLEKLNKELISSNHDLQQFASVASHDLQEPLRKIQVFSTLIKDRVPQDLPAQTMSYVEKIVVASQRMKMLIIDILNYSRLSAHDNSLESIDMQAMIREIVDDFDLKIDEKHAHVEMGELPVIDGNKGQLRQVFYNLISNALKFTSPDRKPHIVIKTAPIHSADLGVSLANEDNYCRIIISDNGIGFEEQFATAIFDLFEKLNPKSSFEGSGIGLAIAKKIIDKHRGLIVATSSIGVGSEFNIILPYTQRRDDDNSGDPRRGRS